MDDEEDNKHSCMPNLGSSLLQAARVWQQQRPTPASSGSTVIDDVALEGGFRYGEITSIAGASGTGKTTLAFHAVASHLLSFQDGEVAIIDTKGTFSPVRLRSVLAQRLHDQHQRTAHPQSGYVYEKLQVDPVPVGDDLVEAATSMLDRVKVMRIFDVAGLVEALREVSEICEIVAGFQAANGAPRRTRREMVADSEDESEDGDSTAPDDFEAQGDGDSREMEEHVAPLNPRIGMVIVDTIANIFGPLIIKSQIQGQALLTTFMRSLQHITTRRQTCTILTNSAVGLSSPKNAQYTRRPEDEVSIFSSVVGKPALGKSFTYLIDTSIMLSTLPKTTDDAEIVYGSNSESRHAQYSSVLEVLQDKNGTRADKWAAFEIVDGVGISPLQ